jgi:hypothetical protein
MISYAGNDDVTADVNLKSPSSVKNLSHESKALSKPIEYGLSLLKSDRDVLVIVCSSYYSKLLLV